MRKPVVAHTLRIHNKRAETASKNAQPPVGISTKSSGKANAEIGEFLLERMEMAMTSAMLVAYSFKDTKERIH